MRFFSTSIFKATQGLVFLSIMVMVLFQTSSSNASKSYATWIPIEFFKGIDTILVTGDNKIAGHALINNYIVADAVVKLFGRSTTKVVPPEMLPAGEQEKPNVIKLSFRISSRTDVVEGKPVKLASLVLKTQFFKRDRAVEGVLEEVSGISYPFIVSPDRAQFEKDLLEAVRGLIEYMPLFISCANTPHLVTNPGCPTALEKFKPWWHRN